MKKKRKMTSIVILHYVKLVFRTALFIPALIVYIYNKVTDAPETFGGFEQNNVLLGFIWIVFILEMLFRFFPSRFESMGCQKQFAKNYVVADSSRENQKLGSFKTTFIAAVSWLILNGIIGVLYLTGVFDSGIMLLIALFYSVCDTVCILFFCPFQTLIMKNKCCGTCRIYNWDYAMMFTPLIFVRNIYAQTLLGAALILLVRWEITVHKHPERFMEESNKSLSCAMCREKLCHHKTQLRHYLKKYKFIGEGEV